MLPLLERGGDASPARTGSEQGLFLAVWWGCVCRRGRGGAVPKKPVPSPSVRLSHSRMAPKAPRIPKIPLYCRKNRKGGILRRGARFQVSKMYLQPATLAMFARGIFNFPVRANHLFCRSRLVEINAFSQKCGNDQFGTMF